MMVNCFGGANTRSVATKSTPCPPQEDVEEWRVDDDAILEYSDSIEAGNRGKYTKRLSKKEKKLLQLAEQARLEQEEALTKYLGKSASSNSIPRSLSSSSLRKYCQTPERKTKDFVMMFDDDGNVIVKGRRQGSSSPFLNGSEFSRSRSEISYANQMLRTPEGSDGVNQADPESEDLSTCTESTPSEFKDSMDVIEPALSSVFNPKSNEIIQESCFKERAMNFDGHIVGRSLVREPRNIRRNLSWGHFSEISFNVAHSSSEMSLPNRRHTVLVLTNEDDLEEDVGDNETPSNEVTESHSPLHRRLSSIYERHHVHLRRLQEQMGDSTHPPEDLLELMARKMFSSHACLTDIDLDELEEDESEVLSDMTKSHDLSECSDKLPKIKTRF